MSLRYIIWENKVIESFTGGTLDPRKKHNLEADYVNGDRYCCENCGGRFWSFGGGGRWRILRGGYWRMYCGETCTEVEIREIVE